MHPQMLAVLYPHRYIPREIAEPFAMGAVIVNVRISWMQHKLSFSAFSLHHQRNNRAKNVGTTQSNPCPEENFNIAGTDPLLTFGQHICKVMAFV